MAKHLFARVTALIVSVFVSLVAGTPYLYGIYAPQLVRRVGLSTSKAAMISLAVTIGTGCGGLPAGLLIDNFGPHLSILIGSSCIFSGYFVLNRIYSLQIPNLLLICAAMCLVGFGSGTTFFSCLKAAQANFPNHRGSASAWPIGAYGLAATVFSLIAAAFYADDTGNLLLFLSLVCGLVAFSGSWFIHVYDLHDESPSDQESSGDSTPGLHRSSSFLNKLAFWGLNRSDSSLSVEQRPLLQNQQSPRKVPTKSKSQSSFTNSTDNSKTKDSELIVSLRSLDSPKDIVLALLRNRLYLIHYLILALCSGMGQMYIYTVGFIVRAQFFHEPGSFETSASLQALQVSVISIAQFFGRIASGMLSDVVKKKLHAQRQWLVLVSIMLMMVAQIMLIFTNSVYLLTLISTFMGCSYGMLNGNYPSIFADTFGTKHFTTAWGLSCSGPIIILYPLQLYFGWIYDSNAEANGKCYLGRECYSGAFQASIVLSLITFGITSALIYNQRQR
ncbi:hypothetical protein FT663_01911 [Candidozyma haemuli var. vulneris]|uniref:Nodulin-like domain-containing protein n=1 Tax=Candidozyma haemuli TaxID=45357 RepID=A0A2V1AVV2_9ASCO|nr:hypothetical protein CXQ85_000433 [[Candida] haemuloni]KAF3989763.1 hypothetical protein FT662_02638 [[Candida] haemuloni var. vulneris]KAF3993321.1 hypothetical protein FT663_01911 [[Candida] haemuloni var. vulneris]PVH21453.1 hypothetical protein CXQ85_000433 [[Candida] haemuloni]